MAKVYLAAPYSYKNPDGTENWEKMEKRFDVITIAAGYLMGMGFYVFSPITHCHPIAVRHELPRTYEFWLTYDKLFIDWCDEVHVLTIPGWEQSKGVQWELSYAHTQSKPVKYWNLEELKERANED